MLRRPRCADCGRRLRGYEYLTPRGIVCSPCFRLSAYGDPPPLPLKPAIPTLR